MRPLHFAATSGSLQVCELLIQQLTLKIRGAHGSKILVVVEEVDKMEHEKPKKMPLHVLSQRTHHGLWPPASFLDKVSCGRHRNWAFWSWAGFKLPTTREGFALEWLVMVGCFFVRPTFRLESSMNPIAVKALDFDISSRLFFK